MSENISNYVEGTINGRGIAGYHRVMYGETQEYLESLQEKGVILMYFEDNPREEGKLTVAKPNVMPEYLKDYATNVVYDEYGNFISCSVEGLITLAEDGTVAQTTADINNTADTTDPNNWADGPSYPVNWPESIDITSNPQEYKVVLVDNEPLRMIPSADTPIAFINIVDAETEAVTSVQVACADTDGWHTIGTLNNPDGIDWKYQAGNLTGSGAPSVVWHAQELGALGVWTDGTDNWTGIAGWFDANWTMLGCGDFDGDGKDSVLMSLSGGLFYSVDLDGTLTGLGGLNWSGWEFGAVGDFAGDGKDDVVLFNKGLNCVVLLADGNADAWTALGTIDSSDWAIAGAGDFNSDGIDDLLVRQDSTGLIGGYAGADMNQWSVVDSDAGYYLA